MNESKLNQSSPFTELMSRWMKSAACLSLFVIAGCVSIPPLPQSLQVPPGQKVLLHAYAKGVQIYICESNSISPDNVVWKLKTPEATLFDACGNVIGSHYAGPTWELGCDGSKTTGNVIHSVPSPDSTAIPWLLVKTKEPEGLGQLQRVTYVQRVNTTGGLPPATDHCQVGQEVRSHYTAEYYFYRGPR